jgi:hypothetical protein
MHYIDIDAIYNLKQPDSTDSFTTTKLSAEFPWPPIMPKQRECILHDPFSRLLKCAKIFYI